MLPASVRLHSAAVSLEQARALVARLKPVRQLRPQALPVKLLAIGTFTGFANMPSGETQVHPRLLWQWL